MLLFTLQVSDIDDIRVTVNGNNIDNIDESTTSKSETNIVVPSSSINDSDSRSHQSHNSSLIKEQSSQDAARSSSVIEYVEKQSDASKSRQPVKSKNDTVPKPPDMTHKQAAVATTVPDAQRSSQQPSAKPSEPPKKHPAPPKPANTNNKRQAPTPDSKNNPVLQASTNNGPSAERQMKNMPQKQYVGTPSPPNTSDTTGAAGYQPRIGTLADLKKKRALELRRNTQQFSSQTEQNNENLETNGHHMLPTVAPVGASLNGAQNGAVASRRGSDASYVAHDDAPRHRFTASTQEIVGGQDDQTGCCVVM